MVALVTGAGGFLGGYVSRGLADAGWTVVPAGRPDVEIPSPAFRAVLERSAPRLVVHCAGPASVAASIADPVADVRGSVTVVAELLDMLRLMRTPPGLVLVSSAAVYGQPERLPIGEQTEPAPISPYGFHRLMCELLAREFCDVYALPVAILRIFSAYGDGLRRQIMWDICRNLIETGFVELSGTGRESRDFVHGDDVGRAVAIAAAEAAFEGEAYNLACGRQTTIAELAGLLAGALEFEPDCVAFSGETRLGDPLHWQADISALRGLGFRPAVEIEAGVASYAAWARDALRVGVH